MFTFNNTVQESPLMDTRSMTEQYDHNEFVKYYADRSSVLFDKTVYDQNLESIGVAKTSSNYCIHDQRHPHLLQLLPASLSHVIRDVLNSLSGQTIGTFAHNKAVLIMQIVSFHKSLVPVLTSTMHIARC